MKLSRLLFYATFSFILLLGTLALSVYYLKNVEDTSGWIEYRKYTKERLDDVYAGVLELEATHRGYIITENEDVYETFDPTLLRIQSNLLIVDSLIGGVPEQKENLLLLSDMIDARIDLLIKAGSIASRHPGWNSDTLKSYVILGDKLMDNIRDIFYLIDQQEDQILQQRTLEVEMAQSNAVRTLVIFSIVVLVLFAVMFYAIFRENRIKARILQEVSKSENRLDTTLSVVSDAIINLEADGTIWGNNRATEKIFHLEANEALNNNILNYIRVSENSDESEQIALNSFGDLSQLVEKHLELTGISKDGKTFPIDFIMESYHFENETYYVATLRDISELKEKESRLKETLIDLQRSNVELEQFAYVASHDLQEPLRKIQAFGNRLLNKMNNPGDEESAKMFAEKMVHASERMQNLILSLLNFSRVSRNLETENPVDLNQVLEHVVDDLEHRIKETNAVLHFDKLPVIKAGRETQLFQLFMNLLGNALKFIREDVRPEITIRCEEGKKSTWPDLDATNLNPGKYYRIMIQDNGIGFDMKYLDKIFTIFQRLHGRTAYEGTGIGLAVCLRVTENHRGYLSAESKEGEGSRFYIYLPKK